MTVTTPLRHSCRSSSAGSSGLRSPASWRPNPGPRSGAGSATAWTLAHARAGPPRDGWPRRAGVSPVRRAHPPRGPARSRSRGSPPTWAEAGVDSPLVPVFVAIIAIAALLQAVFVTGLAIAMRIANLRMAELQETLDREIAKPVAEMARMAEVAVRASEQTLVHAQRMGGVVEDASAKIESVIGDLTRKLQAAGEDLEETAEEIEEDV